MAFEQRLGGCEELIWEDTQGKMFKVEHVLCILGLGKEPTQCSWNEVSRGER